MKHPLWRLPLCFFSLCGYKFASDDTGCWGECITCGKRAGFVSRETLSKYTQAALDHRMRNSDDWR